jgi:ABC-type amino acid transport system permease subunit
MSGYVLRILIVYVSVLVLYLNRYMATKEVNLHVVFDGALNILFVALTFCLIATIAERIAIKYVRRRLQWVAAIALLLMVWGAWRWIVLQRVFPNYWPEECGIMCCIWAATYWISAWQRRSREEDDKSGLLA